MLLTLPKGATWAQAWWVIALAFIAIAALAVGLQGWVVRKTNKVETVLLVGGGLLLVLPLASIVFGGWTVPMHADYVGILLIAIGVLLHFGRVRVLAPA